MSVLVQYFSVLFSALFVSTFISTFISTYCMLVLVLDFEHLSCFLLPNLKFWSRGKIQCIRTRQICHFLNILFWLQNTMFSILIIMLFNRAIHVVINILNINKVQFNTFYNQTENFKCCR